MQPAISIRAAKTKDRPILVQFMESLQEIERALHPNRSPGGEIAAAHLAYLEALAAEQKGKIYVAELSDRILGFIVCFVEEMDLGDLHVLPSERQHGYVSDLYVDASGRRKGVGVALMQAAEQHFLNLGLNVMRVGVLCRNELALEFYQKIGYQPYEVVYEKRLKAL